MPALESLPRKIGPYRVLGKIGEGGMGVVYLARDTEHRQVAVKVLGPAVAGDPDARRRLSREVETMRRVRSPHVAEILDADVTSTSPYIVTRYVPGRTLEATVRDDGPLRGPALDRLAAGLAEALAAVHAAGVVHRDLKPGNVMLEGGQPVVIDFGIAHVPDATRLTKTGLVMGTPGYLAPELIEGHPSSGASDVHSWGATVAFAATGRQPFGTGSYQTVFFRVLRGDADLAGVPPRLAPLVDAALHADPRARPTARWLADQCAAPHPAAAPPPVNGTRLDGTRLDGTRLDGTRLDGTRLDGTRLDGARLDGTRLDGARLDGVQPDGFRVDGTRVLGRPDYLSPAQVAADVADLLPPVSYQRPAVPRPVPRQSAPAPGPRPQVAGAGLVGLAIGFGAIALGLLLPVAGTALVLAAVTVLRAADTAQADLAERRRHRGARPSDILIVIVTAPWTVVRAALTSAVTAPLALLLAAVAWVAAIVFGRVDTSSAALGWAAAGAILWYCVGPPGAREPRRQLRRMTTAVLRTRGAVTVAAISTTALALAVASAALSQPPLMWPVPVSAVPHLLTAVQGWLLGHTMGMLHLP